MHILFTSVHVHILTRAVCKCYGSNGGGRVLLWIAHVQRVQTKFSTPYQRLRYTSKLWQDGDNVNINPLNISKCSSILNDAIGSVIDSRLEAPGTSSNDACCA